jgi:hypothetical protein
VLTVHVALHASHAALPPKTASKVLPRRSPPNVITISSQSCPPRNINSSPVLSFSPLLHTANSPLHITLPLLHIVNSPLHITLPLLHIANSPLHITLPLLHTANSPLHITLPLLHAANSPLHFTSSYLCCTLPTVHFTSHHLTSFTSQSFNLFSSYLCQKDERALRSCKLI